MMVDVKNELAKDLYYDTLQYVKEYYNEFDKSESHPISSKNYKDFIDGHSLVVDHISEGNYFISSMISTSYIIEKEIPYITETVNDDTKRQDFTEILQAGCVGKKQIKYVVVFKKNKVVREDYQEIVVEEAVNEIIVVGSKQS